MLYVDVDLLSGGCVGYGIGLTMELNVLWNWIC